MSAGLPNITGSFVPCDTGGVFSPAREDVQCGLAEGNLWYESSKGKVEFNASRSNSIYGNSDTVQPPTVCMNYIIKY